MHRSLLAAIVLAASELQLYQPSRQVIDRFSDSFGRDALLPSDYLEGERFRQDGRERRSLRQGPLDHWRIVPPALLSFSEPFGCGFLRDLVDTDGGEEGPAGCVKLQCTFQPFVDLLPFWPVQKVFLGLKAPLCSSPLPESTLGFHEHRRFLQLFFAQRNRQCRWSRGEIWHYRTDVVISVWKSGRKPLQKPA